MISRRTGKSWSAPIFFNLAGGSFRPQIGAESTDFVRLFMNEEGYKGLLEDKFEIGGEASIAAGPVGRTASASTNLTLDAGIFLLAQQRRIYRRLAQRRGVTPDNDLNEAIYGLKARDILAGGRTASPSQCAFPAHAQSFIRFVVTNYRSGLIISRGARSHLVVVIFIVTEKKSICASAHRREV